MCNSHSISKTSSVTCPTSTVVLLAQDSSGNTITNGQILYLGKIKSFDIYPQTSSTNENRPCVATKFSTYYTSLRNNITETIFEGGKNLACIGPSGCFFPVGGSNAAVLISGISDWSLYLGLLNPTQSHDFVFCRGAGSINTSSVSLVDCWTSALLAGPQELSTTTTAPCFTINLPANTDIGSAFYSISPASATVALKDNKNGNASVFLDSLSVGTYTINYSFTPPSNSGCPLVTGFFIFSIAPSLDVKVNNSIICSGSSATLTASGATSYTWSPATNLNVSTGSVVIANPTITTTYTVIGTSSDSIGTAKSVVTVNSIPTVNCIIQRDTSIAYTWNIYPAYSSGIVKYVWSWGDGTPSDTSEYPSHTYAIMGSYNICVTVVDSNSCSNTYCQIDSIYRLAQKSNNMIYVNVINKNQTTNLNPNSSNTKELIAYPNPTGNYIYLSALLENEMVVASLYDVFGNEIISTKQKKIDISQLKEGVYLISVTTKENFYSQRIIIQRE